MIELLTATNRGLAILAAVLPAVIWHWVTTPGHSRGHTFFGARVEPSFAESKTGLAILQRFRWRLWSAALVTAAPRLPPD